MTSHYRAGANTERALVALAQADGALSWRVAGSKGLGYTDVLVASKWTGVLALNLKRSAWAPPDERVAMMRLADFGILPVLVCATVRPSRATVWRFLELTPALCSLARLSDRDATTTPPWSEAWLAR